MDRAERLRFVFGDQVEPHEWDEADHDERAALVAERFNLDAYENSRLTIRQVVVEQLIGDEVPEVWATAQRLLASGLDTDLVLNHLDMACTFMVEEALNDESFTQDRYVNRLEQLPLPSPDDVEPVMLDIARAAGVINTEELVAKTTEHFGFDPDDAYFAQLVARLHEDLIGQAAPLIWLPGDRTGHEHTLRENIVLTHELADFEVTLGVLVVSIDLAAFNQVEAPTYEGEFVLRDWADPAHEIVVWKGPQGWLDGYPVGSILAVRARTDGAISIELLPDPPEIDSALVTRLRQLHDDFQNDPTLPVTAEELVFGLLGDDRETFAKPQAPLCWLCVDAGLERRDTEFAKDPTQWLNGRSLRRMIRLITTCGDDEELAVHAEHVLGQLDEIAEIGIDAEPVNEFLDDLDDPEVIDLVIDELLYAPPEVDNLQEFALELAKTARGRRRTAHAHVLAAVLAERALDVAAAEQHLEVAVDTNPDDVLATARLAWYASDRGDAVRALRLWQRGPQAPNSDRLVAAVERNATSGEPVSLGRNDPCWCGSGRKFKQCHMGVVETAPLSERADWLFQKAIEYLNRSGPEGAEAISEVALELAGPGQDAMSVVENPLLRTLVLVEGGWLDRFIHTRSVLLPKDEAMLAATWLTVERSVYQVTSVDAGFGLELRDLRTAADLKVSAREYTRLSRPGMLICACVVPVEDDHRLMGGIFELPRSSEAELLNLLNEADPVALAGWVRDNAELTAGDEALSA